MGFHLKLHHSKTQGRRKQTPSRTSTPLPTTTTNIPTPAPIALTSPIRRSATSRLPSSPSTRLLPEPRTPPPRYAILNPDDRLPRYPQPRNGGLMHPPTRRSSASPLSASSQREAHGETPSLRRYQSTTALRPASSPSYQPTPSFGTPDENARRLNRVREEQARLRRRQSMPMRVAIPVSTEPEGGAWLRCGYCQRRIDEPIPMRTWMEWR